VTFGAAPIASEPVGGKYIRLVLPGYVDDQADSASDTADVFKPEKSSALQSVQKLRPQILTSGIAIEVKVINEIRQAKVESPSVAIVAAFDINESIRAKSSLAASETILAPTSKNVFFPIKFLKE